MTDPIHLFFPILFPIVAGLALLLLARTREKFCGPISILVTVLVLTETVRLFGQTLNFTAPWGGGLEFSLRLDAFSSFIVLASAGFGFFIALYSLAFMQGKPSVNQYYSYFLITLGFVIGAALADSLIVLLFFWEGMLLTLFGMILIGRPGAFRTATKAFVLTGVADLCMMAGVVLVIHLASGGSGMSVTAMSQIHLSTEGGLNSLAFILLIIGATAKAGAMPFHTWIPDASQDAPLPFMALVPAALEKLIGIYFLGRITLELFELKADSGLSTALMVLGCVTILLPVMMALVQKNYKRLLSFHAISQVGYMILGVGTAVPAGIVGGLFHMINHALYKSTLFLTGGAVERQTGTTDLNKLGGLASKMPITFVCFAVAAASISGVPPFNGFFSKELVYDGALERGWIFYAAALAGSFFTAASFLKLGHAVYIDKSREKRSDVKEAPITMLIPMITLATICVLFGVLNPMPIRNLIQPIVGHRLEGLDFAGMPKDLNLVWATLAVLVAALLHHLWGVRKTGSGLGAVDHIHHAPVLGALYEKAEARAFDLYEIGQKAAGLFSRLAWGVDRAIDFFYETVVVKATDAFSTGIRKMHNGSHAWYLAWAMAGLAVILYLLLRVA